MINDIVDDLIVDVPGCPMVTIKDAVRWAEQRLCDIGNAWVIEVDAVAVDGAASLVIDPDLNARPVRVLSVSQGDRRIPFTQTSPGSITTSRRGDITAHVAIKPLRGKDMPEVLFDRHEEGLRNGARGRLMMMPQPWRDQNLAQYHLQLFESYAARVSDEAWTGLQGGSIRMRTPRPV